MSDEYSVQTCRQLREMFRATGVVRPLRVRRYDPADELTYDVTGVAPARAARVTLRVEKFVGGGFAGQVYRVRITDIDAPAGELAGLAVGGPYAVKILIPPSGRARLFRNAIYRLGFQGPFSLQVNPAAARAGALWQKFIRRAAALRFGTERAVVDVLATFVDPVLGGCGEISEWVHGRCWRLEVDDRLDLLKRWRHGRRVDEAGLGSPEYRAKKRFMADFVELLHELGAPELARQYEWATCKSQPNVLKRRDAGDEAAAGLTAVDFRAGLALLPVLPMSPGDFKLIGRGVLRGSLVQFDRGDPDRLQRYVDRHGEHFAGMAGALAELKAAERAYRDSAPDVTHNHVRLLYSRRLWKTILDGAVTSWQVRNYTDAAAAERLRRSRLATLAFLFVGALPFLGRLVRRLWGRADWRRHYARMLTGWGYLGLALRARAAEKLITWHRGGRVSAERALRLARSPGRFAAHLPLSILPAGLHRMLTDRAFAAEKLRYVFVRPVRLYFNADAREKWLREMLAEGRAAHTLSDEDADQIESRITEPFIQKYLKALAVHICTLPITQIVSVTVALIYIAQHPEFTWKEAWGYGFVIVGVFQVVPISPGSLVRGLYVLCLVIRERNFRDYNIAVFLGFFKYIGYLAFPIQMAHRYPALARFMAGHWATGAARLVPVFGERGALLEHGVFNLFYNRPLTLRRRIRKRARRRSALKARSWHVAPCVAAAAALLAALDLACVSLADYLPRLRDIWMLAIWPVLLAGACIAACAGSTPGLKRIAMGSIGGALTGLAYGAAHWVMAAWMQGKAAPLTLAEQIGGVCMSSFLFAIMATIGAVIAEITVFPNEREHDTLGK